MTSSLTEQAVVDMVRRAARGSGTGVRVAIGDDCAVLEPEPGALLLATTDLLIEDVHFRRRDATPADIGWKSLAVNLSDIASMGGRSRWALVALACPDGTTAAEIEAFYDGMLVLAREHGVEVVGGDTSSARCWMVNVTLLGDGTRPRLRSTARAGDIIAVTGPLGRAAAGLAILEQREAPSRITADARSGLVSAQLRPVPRVREGRWLGTADGVTAMIDLSDGLATDLGHIAAESRVGARADVAAIPVTDATRAAADALGVDVLAWSTGGGEDYELLLTCDAAALSRIADGLERATGTRLHAIGTITEEPGVTFVDGHGAPVHVGPGFQHFAPRARRRSGR